MPSYPPFSPKCSFDAVHPDALALYCSDGRFTNAVEELTEGHLQNPRLDTLTIPGGPALLTHGSCGNEEVEVLRTAMTFLVRGHHIKNVVLLAHEFCGFYRSRYPDDAEEELYKRQIADLRAAAKWLHGEHPEVDTRLYFANTTGSVMLFEPVDRS